MISRTAVVWKGEKSFLPMAVKSALCGKREYVEAVDEKKILSVVF